MKTKMLSLTTKLLLSLIFFTLHHSGNAQDKSFFVPDPLTAKWSYSETDGDGNQVATVFYSVEKMSGDAINGKVKLLVEKVNTQSPQDTVKSYVFYRFKDGEYMVDMNALFEGEVLASLVDSALEGKETTATEEEKEAAIEEMKRRIKISGEVRGMPRYPQAGQLPDYEFNFKFAIINMKVTGSDRRITGTELLHTPVGTYECHVMEETVTMKAMMQKDIEKIRYWYAYGIGLVKQSSYDKNGHLTSTLTLNSINW